MPMKLSELCISLNGKLHGNDSHFETLSTDSRAIKHGELFVAIRGENFDGHHYVEQAAAQGAVAAIVDNPMVVSIPTLQVADTRLALGQIAMLRRNQFQIPVVALTGSCGKTTVKEMIRSILAQQGITLANQGTLNNDIGVPLTLLKLMDEHKYAVIEMGANHPGEIAYLTNLVKPKVAFINNIAPAHLEGFGSVEGVAKAKAEIFTGLASDGIALINADDHYENWLQNLLVNKTQIFRFGIKNKNVEVTAQNIHADALGHFSFDLITRSGQIAIHLPVLGEHNVLNAVAAATAALALDINLQAIKVGLETMQPVAGRLILRQSGSGARILDDTYNSNPCSAAAALQVLAQYPGEKIFVMGDMAELGATSEELHREIGLLAKKVGVNKFYAYGRLTVLAAEAFGEGSYHFATQEELCAALRSAVTEKMSLLVKGSRSAKMENVVTALL